MPLCRAAFSTKQLLPFRFGTIISEQQLRITLRNLQARAGKSFAHVRGCVEMDLKIIWQRSKPDPDQIPKRNKARERRSSKRSDVSSSEMSVKSHRNRVIQPAAQRARRLDTGWTRSSCDHRKTGCWPPFFTSSKRQYPEVSGNSARNPQ